LQSSAVSAPEIRRIADRIRVVVTDKARGKFAPATVTLRTGGRTFSRTVDHMPGSAEAPLSAAELDEKVEDCLQRGATPLSPASRRSLRKKIDGLEDVADMATFFADA
jgi:2-methylcitrate dehydratase PrpD